MKDVLIVGGLPTVLWPGVILALSLLALFGVFLVRAPATPAAASREEGSALLPSVFIGYWYWLTTPLTSILGKIGVTPNHITGLSVLLAGATGFALAQGRFMLGTWLFVAAITCDLLDGLLARSQNRQSVAGAFFDSFCDRLSEGLVLGGLAYYGRDGWLLVVSVAALIASVMVSYARARGEALGVDCKVGLMQRPERMLVTAFTLFFAALLPSLMGGQPDSVQIATFGFGALAVLAAGTAVRRAYATMRALDQRGEARPEQAAPPAE